MDYTEINGSNDFHRNMRKTPWLKLFPHWWSENDPLLNVIGDEVERIKALSFFALLNAGIKPPVMIWQNSITHDEHHIKRYLTQLTNYIDIQAPLYKTWGKITLTNYSKDDLENIKIMVNPDDGILIDEIIHEKDIVVFDLSEQKATINNKEVQFFNIKDGMPYFKTVQNRAVYDENTPLHNEVIRLEISSVKETKCEIDVDIQLNNVVFTNEQNIEITGLELLPIEKVELYVKHDFEFNTDYNGWHKVYRKKYDKNTNVIYDMITTQFYTKEFYVHVWFKELQYPYKVGFPCYQDAELDSMYHVNNRLDTWGEQLGLSRRIYRKDIDEKLYYKTYPEYYPFDIEQDYWYWRRLTNEYSWNHLAINDVDIQDNEGNNVMRLYSINPFVEDFVVHAKSKYPKQKEYKNQKRFTPVLVSQQSTNKKTQQVAFTNAKNILKYDDKYASIQLLSRAGNNINNLKYQSKELWSFFDLSDLPEDIKIDDIKVLVEADSTDNKKDKYSTEDTGFIIESLDGNTTTFIPLYADKSYQLSEQLITYSSTELLDYIKQKYKAAKKKEINQIATIGKFESRLVRKEMQIPFKLQENGEVVKDITDVWVYYDKTIQSGKYLWVEDKNMGYIKVGVPNVPSATKMTIVCKSKEHSPFTCTIDIGAKFVYKKDGDDFLYEYVYEEDEGKDYIIDNGAVYLVTYLRDKNGTIVLDTDGTKIEKKREKIPFEKEKIIDYVVLQGPYANGVLSENEFIEVTDDWQTQDLRNILQKQGIFFRNIYENNNEQSETTIHLKNVTLEITYSDKKTHFELDTKINTDVLEPRIGEYQITIRNTGEKVLSTHIDVITPPNIQLSQNYIEVENLAINEPKTTTIDIYPQSPIDDGYYDILAVCEGKERRNQIGVFNTGLIDTGVTISSHHGKYNQPITLTAKFSAIGAKFTDIEHINFYVNNYVIKEAITLENGVASITFMPEEYDFIDTGLMPIDVKYDGNDKFAPCSARNELFISKSTTKVVLDFNKPVIPYASKQTLKATVTYNEDGVDKNVTDGDVSFYLGDTPLGRAKQGEDGFFTLLDADINVAPGYYTLWARYGNSDIYSMDEAYTTVRVSGGKVHINVFDVEAPPIGTVEFKARVTDDNGDIVETGCIQFKVQYDDLINIDTYGKIVNGVATATEELDIDIKDKITPTIKANLYEPEDNEECESSGYVKAEKDAQGTLTIAKRKVIFNYKEQFYGTQYEPLGFVIDVLDEEDNSPVNSGDLTLRVNNDIESTVAVKDGKARFIINPTIFWENWDKTSEFTLFIAGDKSSYYIQRNGENINLKEMYKEMHPDEDIDDKGLYLIAKENRGYSQTYPFEIQEDTLVYHDNDLNDITDGDALFYLDIENRDLYRISSTRSEKRAYNVGIYGMKLIYNNSQKYSNKSLIVDDILTIEHSDVDLDLHTYNNLTYSDENPITCYTTYYESDDNVTGKVDFYIDDEYLYASNISDKKSLIPANMFQYIKYGEHLLEARYHTDDGDSHTYTMIQMGKITPTIDVQVNGQIKGKDAKAHVTIGVNNPSIVVSGFVHLYLNDELIETLYLYGNEGMQGIVREPYTMADIGTTEGFHNDIDFIVRMPNDIDIEGKNTLRVEYEGNDLINSTEKIVPLHQEEVDVELSWTPTTVAYGQECFIPISVNAKEDPDIHDINEGYIIVIHDSIDSREEVARFSVVNNTTTIKWTPTDSNYVIKYALASSYKDSDEYNLSDSTINFIDPQETVTYNKTEYATLRDAIQCIKDNGTLIIQGEEIFDTSFEVKKPITIKGESNEDGNESVINLANNFILNSDINLYNIEIKTDNKSRIVNKGKLKIVHSILRAEVESFGELTINRCLVYNRIDAVDPDLDNNWWGRNQCPYKVNNYIILTLDTEETPAVIVDDINVHGRMIGANGEYYSIPSAQFELTADSGLFSIDSGSVINGKIYSTYLDATQEGKIYLTVDNQTVECDVYDYDRKTEIIIDSIYDVPLDHYIGLRANVRSCIDNYYENSDMNGYVDWYINGQQIGHSYIVNNYATIHTYMNDYEEGEHKLTAVYKPYEYYFGCKQEIYINVINPNNVLYVSANGYDTEIGHGTFEEPYKTIGKAISELGERNTIYLKDGEYDECEINIDREITIKGYGNNAIFTNITGDYIFTNSKELNIERINFINNQVNTLFNNQAKVNISQSLISENKEIFSDSNYAVEYSAILNNEDNITGENCWYGDDTDVQLHIKQSKSKIYDGVVALLTAQLLDNNGEPLNKSLPSRIAQFISDDYSLRPMEDYTYGNNEAYSILDTNYESKKNKPILTILDTTQYINEPINIRCHVQNGLRQDMEGTVNFKLTKNGREYINEDVKTTNGYAVLTSNALLIGEYDLACTFEDTQMLANITVKKQDIQIKNFLPSFTNHKTTFKCECIDGNNNVINDLTINVLIDGDSIGKAQVVDGNINVILEHDFLIKGAHTLTLSYNEDSYFDTLIYQYIFTLDSIDTEIEFYDTTISQNVIQDLEIAVNDKYGQPVVYGTVNIYLNGDIVVENQSLTNGKYILKDFVIKETGQHSFIVSYNGSIYGYNESSETYTINTNIYNISIKGLNDFNIDLNEAIVIDNDVIDVASRLVSLGKVNIYLGDILLKESVPIEIGHLTFRSKLPSSVMPGTYNLNIYYVDETDTYLDTLITRKITVNRIETDIDINNIQAYPNQEVQIPYSIISKHGKIGTGILEILYKDEDDIIHSIYSGTVSDGLFNYVTFTAPDFPTGTYQLTAKYTDTTGYYTNKEKNIILNMQRNNVVLTPNYNSYYPQKTLIFTVDVRNQNDKRVNTGTVDIYIDNIKIKEDVPVVNGQASTELIFNQAKTYQMDILFKDENYYLDTNFTQNFFVGRLKLNEINPVYNQSKTIMTELDFNTIDDYNVTDGIVYIYIDNIQVGSYYIKEKDKKIDLDISYLIKGDHKVHISYGDSMVFDDYENTYDLYIEPKEATINIESPINVSVDSTITLYGSISAPIDGIISFKIGNKYIGSTEVTKGSFEYPYTLPTTFESGDYKITARFFNNPYYEDIVRDDIDLLLSKQDLIDEEGNPKMSVSLNTTSPEYTGKLEIDIDTELNNPLVHLFIKNLDTEEKIKIGHTTLKHHEYILSNDIIKNEKGYKIIGEYSGSPRYNALTIESETFNIVPYTPTTDNSYIMGYYNGEITLPHNIFVDAQNNPIESETVIYHFNDDIEVTEYSQYVLPEDYTSDIISVSFVSNDTNKYNDSTGTIVLLLNKSTPTFEINTPEYFNFGEDVPISVEVKCDTTKHPVNNILINGESYELTDNKLSIQYSTSESRDLELLFEIEEDTFFNYTNIKKTIPLNRGEYSEVSSSDNVQNAINTTENGGTVIIKDPLNNKTLTIDKDLNIKGSTKLSNCVINHESNHLHIEGITFENCKIESKGNIDINNCKFINSEDKVINLSGEENTISNTLFKDNKETCITVGYYNIHTTIDNCVFNHNNGSSSGVCIETKRLNSLRIKDTQFINNIGGGDITACIYGLGDMLLSECLFYNNKNCYDIQILKGNINADTCIFADTNTIMPFTNNIAYDLDYNYWGETDTPPIQVNNYLIGLIDKSDNPVYIKIIKAKFEDEAFERDFEKTYTVEVINDGD